MPKVRVGENEYEYFGGNGSIGDMLSELQWRAGIGGGKPAHVTEAEQRRAMDPEAWTAQAFEILGREYGYSEERLRDPETKARVAAATEAAAAELRAERGVSELKPTPELAQVLAYRVGNKLHNAAVGGSPVPEVPY